MTRLWLWLGVRIRALGIPLRPLAARLGELMPGLWLWMSAKTIGLCQHFYDLTGSDLWASQLEDARRELRKLEVRADQAAIQGRG